MPSLYRAHARALTALYSDVENFALGQPAVFPGTAGSVVVRQNASGFRFYAHQFYGADGKQREKYLGGPIGSAEPDAAAESMRARILELKQIVPSLRLLGREGFHLVDSRTYATVASLFNHQVFQAGGMLIGSHAYGVILNALGTRSAPYATQDIDIARREQLTFDEVPPGGFLQMLTDSGIEFVEVPRLDNKTASTSFKQRGGSPFHVDLLVPSPNEGFPILPVPELKAHATGVPYLQYLLQESQTTALLAREGCCIVRVPLPERFAVHKLLVSRLRSGPSAKSERDVFQAAVLCAVLATSHPGAIESAVGAVPPRARKYLKPAVGSARKLLEADHPRAWQELTGA